MKTAIVFYSKHHGNTRKLLDAIAEKNEVTLVDVTNPGSVNLDEFDRIGFASGIYYGAFAKQIQSFAAANLPKNKDIFYLYTHGAPKGDFLKGMREIATGKGCREIGEYHCQGFDTFGPFKLIGGIAKGHPTEREIHCAVVFYERL